MLQDAELFEKDSNESSEKAVIPREINGVGYIEKTEVQKMKLKEGYLPKEVAGEFVLFPVGQSVVDLKSIVSVNQAGKFLVEKLQDEICYDALAECFYEEYEAETEEEKELLKRDLDAFLEQLRQHDMLCM